MGVHGLWQLIQSTGKPVSLESLEGKVLAVDVSVWLHQLSKGMRDKDGKPLQNAYLHGLFTRICKLLYYKIKPVFVFDGGVPTLKKQTLAGRRRRREKAEEASGRATQKLLTNLIRSQAVKQALGEDTPVPLPKSSPSKSKDTLFQLPPLSEESQRYLDDGAFDEDQFWEERREYQEFLEEEYQGLDSIDVESEEFLSLPPEIQHEIITDMRERRKNYNMSRIRDLPQESSDFSNYQLKKILKHSKLFTRLTEVEKELNQQTAANLAQKYGEDFYSGEVQARRIMSDETTHFVLVKGLQKSKQEEIARIKKELNIEEPTSGTVDELFLQSDCRSKLKAETELEEKMVSEEKIDPRSRSSGCDAADVNGIFSTDSSEFDSKKVKSEKEADQIVPVGKEVMSTKFRRKKKLKIEKRPQRRVIRENTILSIESDDSDDDCNTNDSKQDICTLDESHVSVMSKSAGTKTGNTSNEPIAISDQYNSSSESEDDFIEVNIDPKNIKADDLFPAEMFVPAESVDLPREPNEDDVKDVEKVVGNELTRETIHRNVQRREITSENMAQREIIHENVAEVNGSSSEKENHKNNPDSDGECVKVNADGFVRVHVIPCGEDEAGDDKNVSHDESDSDDDSMDDSSGRNSTTTDDDDDDGSVIKAPITVEDLLSLGGEKGPAEGTKMLDGNSEEVKAVKDISKEFQGLTEVDLKGIRDELEQEVQSLQSEVGRQQRLATSISDQMHTEAQELLRLFGVPYVVSPSEAEAQCAQLDLCDLVQGTITDDSDIWLFGGKRVYKNFFNQQKHVEFFRQDSIQSSLGLTREALINIALLCGSDYTEGIQRVGPVTAMEILAEFPGEGHEGLLAFRSWWEAAQQQVKIPKESSLKSKLRDLEIHPGFPSEVVVDAYMKPTVENSREPFSWTRPDLYMLREFAIDKLGWSRDKTDETLLPVMKRLAEKTTQGKISTYFRPENFMAPAKMKSKRLQQVVNKFLNPVTTAEEADLDSYPSNLQKAKQALKSRSEHDKGQGHLSKLRSSSVIKDEVDLSEDSDESAKETGKEGIRFTNKGKQPVGKGRQAKGKGGKSSTEGDFDKGGFFLDEDSAEERELRRTESKTVKRKTVGPGTKFTDFLRTRGTSASVMKPDLNLIKPFAKNTVEPRYDVDKMDTTMARTGGKRKAANVISKPSTKKKSKTGKTVPRIRVGVTNLSESESD